VTGQQADDQLCLGAAGTIATDTVAPSTSSTPLLLLLPVGRYWHHGRTLGGPSHPWKTSAGTSGGSAAPLVLLLQGEKARARVLVDLWTLTCINWLCTKPYVRGHARAQPRPSALVPRHSRLVAHALARIHSVSRSVVEERRLADAGVAPHDKCTAAAGARRIERSVDDCAFGRAHAEPLRLRRHS
jgi:hypothetical protein